MSLPHLSTWIHAARIAHEADGYQTRLAVTSRAERPVDCNADLLGTIFCRTFRHSFYLTLADHFASIPYNEFSVISGWTQTSSLQEVGFLSA